MICPACKSEIAESSASCSVCGAKLSHVRVEPNDAVIDPSQVMKDSWRALQLIFRDPIGGIARAYRDLGDRRALLAGVIFAIAMDLCELFAILKILPSYVSVSFGDVLQILLYGLSLPVFLFVSLTVLSKTTVKTVSWQAAAFVSGITVLPLAGMSLVVALIGIASDEVLAVFGMFAFTFTIMLLFSGCTKILQFSDRSSFVLVPVVLMISAGLSFLVIKTLVS